MIKIIMITIIIMMILTLKNDLKMVLKSFQANFINKN